jgi:hypothetical protein
MALQYSDLLRTNQVNQIQPTVQNIGTVGNTLRLYTGPPPATCATAEGGTLLASIPLPNPFLNAGTAGVVTIANAASWTTTGLTLGVAGHFRIYDAAGTPVCHMQGNVTSDLLLSNTTINPGQTVTVATFTISAANG